MVSVYAPRVWRYFKPHWKLAMSSGIAVVLSTGLALLSPWPLKVLIDNVLGNEPVPWFFQWAGTNQSMSLLVCVVLIGLAIIVAEGAINVIETYMSTRLDQYMTLDLRGDLLRHAERLSLAFHDQ